MQPPFAGKFTFTGDGLWLSEFRLPPGSPSWHLVRQTTREAALIAFPRTTVAIRHDKKAEVIADPMSAVVYSPGQVYSRRLVSAAGDACTLLAVRPELIAQAVADFEPAADPASYRFPFSAAAIRSGEYLAIQRLRHRLATGQVRSSDEVAEELYWLLGRVIAGGYGPGAARSPASSARRELAEAVRDRLGRDLGDPMRLEDLSAELNVSRFHLVRVFREATGQPIHAYRTELRLRASLPLIAGGVRLADVALEVGFASHAHLTDRFARAYGITPAAWRDSLCGRPGNLSKNLKAKRALRLVA